MMEMAKGRNNQTKAMMTVSSSPGNSSTTTTTQMLEEEDFSDLRRGPWTVEEDLKLINYIASHGEGRWNSLARCAGLKRTGKSCRLRWLNYLRPDVRRGNITLEEQLMILELHSRWGNRWSKIAQHLPGRTDNEIKNYWRTRVQKHAKQLKCDVNSKQFKDAMRYLWMPRLMERIQAAAASTATPTATPPTCFADANNHHHLTNNNNMVNMGHVIGSSYTPENSSTSDSFGTPISDLTTDYYNIPVNHPNKPPPVDNYFPGGHQVGYSDSITSPTGYFSHGLEFPDMDQNNNRSWVDGGDTSESFWYADDIWFLQQQLSHNNV